MRNSSTSNFLVQIQTLDKTVYKVEVPKLTRDEIDKKMLAIYGINSSVFDFVFAGQLVQNDHDLEKWHPAMDDGDYFFAISPRMPTQSIRNMLLSRVEKGTLSVGRGVHEINYSSPFFGEVAPQEFIDAIYDELEYVDRLFSENNIPYSIVMGTLLGAFRHGGLIPNDDDVDISVHAQYKNLIVGLSDKIKLDGYELYYHPEGWFKLRKAVSSEQKTSNGLDIFFMTPAQTIDADSPPQVLNFEEAYPRLLWGQKEWLPINALDDVIRIKFGHLIVSSIKPAYALEYLDRVYGNEWAYETKKLWDHVTDTHCQSMKRHLSPDDYFFLSHSKYKTEGLGQPLIHSFSLSYLEYWIMNNKWHPRGDFWPMNMSDLDGLEKNKIINEAQKKELILYAETKHHYLLYNKASEAISPESYSINLLWIHDSFKDFSPFADLMADNGEGDSPKLSKLFYDRVLVPILQWNITNPESRINYWYDGNRIGKNKNAVINNSYIWLSKIKKININNIRFKDIRSIDLMRSHSFLLENKDIYWQVDWAKVLITDEELNHFDYAVMADLDIMPFGSEHLFDRLTKEELDLGPGYQFGRDFDGQLENSFMIFSKKAQVLHRKIMIEEIIQHHENIPESWHLSAPQGVFGLYPTLWVGWKRDATINSPSVEYSCGKPMVTGPSRFSGREGLSDSQIVQLYRRYGL